MFKVKGVFKHYDWGGKTFLPALLNHSNEEKKPYAEYWLGSNLHEGIEKMPYLFKVQDVEKMLSIQVHPSKEAAKIKFEEENKKGIPVDAPNRNFKDANHKPELLAPLTDFYLLHGFKPVKELQQILNNTPELNFLTHIFGDGDYKKLYSYVMNMPQEEVNNKLAPLIQRIVPEYNAGKYSKENENFWAARAALTFNKDNNIDRGIFSIYLFNIVKMVHGQALFQPAGLPHAYLEGRTMEIMADSDNVLRGGLTPKHIDVNELLQHVIFEATIPNIISGQKNDTPEEIYITPADDFQLSRIKLKPGEGISIAAIISDIYFIYEGRLIARADEDQIDLKSGDALLVKPGTVVHFGTDENATIYRATAPLK
ncbi:MAG: mannose-6-phosphate isomerase, class I [Chitinophagaceae bacterium]|nr:mannose-6-phosphate isomerase, class I [Chitinophagaceae bacterium]